MKTLFPGYYRPSDDEFAELWSTCLFAPDANVLLDLYRYNVKTRDELFTVLESVSDKLWLPYQVAYEYQSNRLEVIRSQKRAYDGVRNALKASLNKATEGLNVYKKHQIIDTQSILRKLERAHKAIQKELDGLEKSHPEYSGSLRGTSDPIRSRIDQLFEGKIGKAFSEEELRKIYREGADRYSKRIPPGYADEKDKPGDEKYGDLVVWKELLAKAKETGTALIFITNDNKEDWWEMFEGKTIGPQPALINEMRDVASVPCYMYSADQFMEYARNFLNQTVDQAAIDEVREVRSQPRPHNTMHYTMTVDNPLFSTWLPVDDSSRAYETGKLSFGTLVDLNSGHHLLDAYGKPFRRFPYLVGGSYFGDPASGVFFEPKINKSSSPLTIPLAAETENDANDREESE